MLSIARRIACVRRHRWQTVVDPAGPLTTCARCGALRHEAGDEVVGVLTTRRTLQLIWSRGLNPSRRALGR